MKTVFALAVLACVAACALASGYDSYDRYNRDGFKRVANGVAAPYSNDDRQRAVNHRAEYVGASSGTFKYDDVPGTNRDFGYGYGGYNRYNDGYYGAYNDGYYGDYNRGRYYSYGRH